MATGECLALIRGDRQRGFGQSRPGIRGKNVNRLVGAITLASALALSASSAHASSFTIDFCVVNPDECGSDKIAEARLTFDEVAGGDLNDYTATLFFKGAAAGAPGFIDQVQFKIDGASYESLPSLTAAPAGGTWTPFFGSVPNCGTGGDGNSVCADHNGAGAALGNNGSLTWIFGFDLVDSFGALSAGQPVNMRASFGRGQFSPGGGPLPLSNTPITLTSTETETQTQTETSVPEPTVLSLLGAGMVAAAARRKFARKQ